MIRTHVRTKGASALGAQRPGESGPFGVRPALDEDERGFALTETPGIREPDTQTSARRTDGTAGFTVTPANAATNNPSTAHDTTKENQ